MKGMRSILVVGAAAALLAASACRGGESQETTGTSPASSAPAVPPERSDHAAPGAAAGGDALPLVPTHATAGAEIGWDAPQGWVVETPSSAMRRAQYRIPPASGDGEGGECAVFYFGAGQGGEVGANVQRWAAQFEGAGGKPPAPKVTEVKTGGRSVTRVEVHGTYQTSGMGAPHGGGSPKPGYMLLGAIVPGGDANWFFKCTGPEKTMEKSRAQFDAMIASVHPGS